MKFDLHIHTKYSDGTDSPNEILLKAEQLGLEAISITDHDNCNAYHDMDKSLFSGRIINGIEMQAVCLGQSIELLGYGFGIKNLNKLIDGLYLPFAELNIKEMELSYDACRAMGMVFDEDVLTRYDKNEFYYATDYLHSEIIKNPFNRKFVPNDQSRNDAAAFFRKHTSNPQSPFYINENLLLPSYEKVIHIIHKAGGKVFIPHIFQYGNKSSELLTQLLQTNKIDGIECYYPSFTTAQTNYLSDICIQNNLLISGGSDYHGSCRGNEMGLNINVIIK